MLFSSAFILAASLLSLPANATKRSVTRAPSFKPASPITASDNVLTLKRSTASSSETRRNAARAYEPGNHITDLTYRSGNIFSTQVMLGTRTFQLQVDTGFSDTWVATSDFTCLDTDTHEVTMQSECGFGPLYDVSDETDIIPDILLDLEYKDNDLVKGFFGVENVTIAGISINQTVAFANWSAWRGDGTMSGMLGLGYPALTTAYMGDHKVIYDPITTNMFKTGLVAPLFSIAIERQLSGPGGYLTLGGIPPINYIPEFTSTPILISHFNHQPADFGYYYIGIDGLRLNGAVFPAGQFNTFMVDTGSTLIWVTTFLAQQINAAFEPPAVYDPEEELWIVTCSAKPPSFGIVIGDTPFFINAADMIMSSARQPNGIEWCISTVMGAGNNADTDTYILVSPFMKKVLSVYDVGAGLISFAPRMYHWDDL